MGGSVKGLIKFTVSSGFDLNNDGFFWIINKIFDVSYWRKPDSGHFYNFTTSSLRFS